MLLKSLKNSIIVLITTGSIFATILLDETFYDHHEVVSSTAEELGEIPQLRAFAVSHKGETIIEEYYHHEIPDLSTNLHSMSITKSITSLLIGIAIDKGYIKDVDQRLSQILDKNEFSMNEQFSNLTIRQLLSMKAGFDWHCTDPAEYVSWITSSDQINYILNKPFTETPGNKFHYNDGAAHLLSVVITEATDMSTVDFANKNLFEPLGIDKRIWYMDNRGYNLGNICLFLSVEDMVKIGELVINDGLYDGNRIISETWINESTSSQSDAKGYTHFASEYGYCWWTGEILEQPYIMAMGYGGQFIFIFKKLNLVIATLSSYLASSQTSFENADKIYMSVLLNIVSKFAVNS